ncbi:MAG: transcriptional repressor [Turneriella sp.]|nr:transcriptional repressor [Leptospiraceae bacterium]MCX7632197.1 transcriptional repressor [Turneriella sp.]
MQSKSEIAEFLRQRGIRLSLPKLEIAAHVFRQHRHFTAEEIFREINSEYPRVSRATVFNVLNAFVAHGLLRKVDVRSDAQVFDSNTSEHDHVVVAATGKIYDVTIPEKTRQLLLEQLWQQNPHLPRNPKASVIIHV